MPEDKDKIDSFQLQIDELNELCAEVLSAPQECKSWNERLGMMILKLQDGTLEKRYALRLEKWLLSDPEAFEYYIDFTNLTAELHMHFCPESLEKKQIGVTAHS